VRSDEAVVVHLAKDEGVENNGLEHLFTIGLKPWPCHL